MKKYSYFLTLIALTCSALFAAEPFKFSPPSGFNGPAIGKQLDGPGDTFSYKSADGHSSIIVTIMHIPPEGKADNLGKILAGLMTAIRAQHTQYKKTPNTTFTIASVDARSCDWEGTAKGVQLKGRMIIAIIQGQLYSIQFKAPASDWAKSISSFEKSVGEFEFTQPKQTNPNSANAAGT